MSEPAETLDLGAFKHVVVPIGVVIALGVARIVNALSDYIQHRRQIRFDWPHSLWCGVIFLYLVGLWWISWGLREVDAELWSYFTLIFLLVGPALLYLATTLLLPEVPKQGQLDLSLRFEEVGRAFFLSLAGFFVWLVAMELLLLREELAQPKRLNQTLLVVLFGAGAVFPTRRAAVRVICIVFPLALFALATVRAKLV